MAVTLYQSGTFNSGSSLSHLDTDFFGTNSFIMTHAVTTGQSVRTLSGIELGIFQDLGYTVSAVPVPVAIWFMFSGIAALFGMKRKKH